MLILLSPAKSLDYETPAHISTYTQPEFLTQAQNLIQKLRAYSPQELASLMKLSDKLAALNVARYASWQQPFNTDNAKQAALAFTGDVYTGLASTSLAEDDLLWAQNNILILSGLYGLLKPLDLMQAYRLEMGTKLENTKGNNLYDFWQGIITPALNAALSAQQPSQTPELVNLASNEYFKAVEPKQLQAKIIHPVFKDYKNGQYKIISFYAKKARGLMARWAITHKVTEAEKLKQFDTAGYYFSQVDSDANKWVFLRDAALV